jgi:folate-binding protein YgfZ
MNELFLKQIHKQAGANFTQIREWSIPSDYGDLARELETINHQVGLLDRSYLGKIALRGTDTLDLLNRISTNDLLSLALDSVADTVFVTPKGRLIDYCRVVISRDETILISSFLKANHLIDWINRFIILEDVSVHDVSMDYAWLTLVGPHARQFLGQLLDKSFSEKDEAIWMKIGKNIFPALKNSKFRFPAYNFCFRNSDAQQIVPSLLEQLRVSNGCLFGDTAFQILRVESGMPDGLSEITQDYNPHEARLVNAISFTKGCYTGQEVIARLDTYDKVQKYLMILELTENMTLYPPLEIFIDDENVGHLTSYVYNPVTRKSIGLGYLKKMYTTESDIYMEVQNKDVRIPARSRIPPQAYL